MLALATNGATIVFYQHLPNDVPGMFQFEQRKKELEAIIHHISFAAAGKVQKASVGKGFFFLGDNLDALMSQAKVSRESLVDKGLQYNRRSYNGGHYYFISNPSRQALNEWLPLQTTEKNIVIFNPMLVTSGLAKTRTNAGNVEVYLQLQPGESCILQTAQNRVAGKKYLYYKTEETATAIDGNWKIKFLKGGPSLPASLENISLGSWINLPGEAVKIFSGSAQYSVQFKKPSCNAAAWLLNLGNVQENAELWLNGKKLQTLIGPSFQLSINAALLKQDNSLQVIVTNGMPNRIVDLENRGVPWKKFSNTNFPSRLAENRGSDGIFTAIKWQPKASGLIGPVTLTPVIFIK